MHHYNFPPYSAGETGRMGGVNRRAIGHGALAEKALVAVLPDKDPSRTPSGWCPSAWRSNGSTSMGSACASTLALMDGGVPIKAPVAGIAMGLLMNDIKDITKSSPTSRGPRTSLATWILKSRARAQASPLSSST